MARLHFSALSDRGIRSTNNDAFCAEKMGKYHVFGVAEGISDPAFEGAASAIAISCFREAVKRYENSPAAALGTAVHESDTRIGALMAKSPRGGRDATHLSACLIDNALECTILDTGEGNAYLISRDSIRVPREHALSRSPEGLEFLEGNHGGGKTLGSMISHTVGEPRILTKSDFISVNLADRYLLLSSGGLHDSVKKEKVADIVLRNGENVDTSCEFLLQEALSAGSEQTLTIVLVHGHLH